MEKKELTRFELAIVKRTAQNTKSLRTKRDKLVDKINKAQEELTVINETIDKFEAPIKEMTGGFTSEEYLNDTTVNEGNLSDAVGTIPSDFMDSEENVENVETNNEQVTEE